MGHLKEYVTNIIPIPDKSPSGKLEWDSLKGNKTGREKIRNSNHITFRMLNHKQKTGSSLGRRDVIIVWAGVVLVLENHGN